MEGPTDDPSILELRTRQRRNLLLTLMMSQGVPMLLGGDELGRTQAGNNNAYCQDNETSWFDWEKVDESLLEYTAAVVALRREHPVFRRRRFFEGAPLHRGGVSDIEWFTPDGAEMTDAGWQTDQPGALMVFLNGAAIPTPDARGEAVADDSYLLLFNAGPEPRPFTLPEARWGRSWRRVLDTAEFPLVGEQEAVPASSGISMQGHHAALLSLVPDAGP